MFRKRFDKEEEEFQSAPPVKGAIRQGVLRAELRDVSIRAPREGGDLISSSKDTLATRFNPRPP